VGKRGVRMIGDRQSSGSLDGPRIGPAPPAAGLDALTAAVRTAVRRRADWGETAELVATELEQHLPAPDIVTAEQRARDPESYRSHVLHSEPDEGSRAVV
jgi:hypothetical protein